MPHGSGANLVKRILTAWLLLAAAAPALSGCVAVMTVAVEKAYEDRSTAAQLTDAKIHARILAYLTGINTDLVADVNTDIWQGRVLLTGSLDDAGLRGRIVKYARADRHVRAVYDHIQVVSKRVKEKRRQGREDSDLGRSINDAWISAKVKARLLSMYNVKSVNYRWQTVLSRVYLIGSATSRAERDLVLRVLHATKGVRGVTSYIGILKKKRAK